MENSPPRAPPIKYATPLGTRWQKEKAAAGQNAFDFPDDPRHVGPWVIGECVGKGASGRVKIAKHRRTGQLAAVKILPLQAVVNSRASLATQQAKCEKQRLGVDREITMMKLMNHPNIMRIYDVYEGDKELYLILEYVEGGELFDFLVNRGKLPHIQALAYFKQIVYGLNYAHTFSIIHRDLKPENILIHSFNPPLIKIADWGMAAFAPPDRQLDTSCGSPHYASPEIVNGLKYEGTATDIWSCGVILFALLTGRLPFDDKNVRTLLSKVKVGKYDMPSFIDPQAKDLLSRMLVVDVAKRITMPEILAHPWLQNDTPGIVYVPAPSLFDLAQPLLSPAHVDRDLLESLRVIWGRDADIEVIRMDLLSPPGFGSLAKAFYFLLERHREHALGERGILMDIENHNGKEKVVMKPYTMPSPNPKSSLSLNGEMLGRSQRGRPVRMATAPPAPPPYTECASSVKLGVVSPARSRPSSPAGPRPRPTSSPVSPHRDHSLGPTSEPPTIPEYLIRREESKRPRLASRTMTTLAPAHPRPAIEYGGSGGDARMYTSTPVYNTTPIPIARTSISRRGRMIDPFNSPEVAPYTVPAAAESSHRAAFELVRAPAPEHAPVPRFSQSVREPLAADVEVQRTIDDIANRMNIHAQHVENVRGYDQVEYSDVAHGYVHVHPFSQARGAGTRYDGQSSADRMQEDASTGENKENRSRYDPNNPMQASGGLGFGKAHAGNAKNSSRVVFSPGEGGQRKERKGRPPPLDFHQSQIPTRRSTFSSTAKSPLLMSPNSASILGSPVVGEFKGWFSNLFNWKQSYVLYSVEHLVATQEEAIRLLEQAGVSVAIEDSEGLAIFKCWIDDTVDSMGSVVQKSVRFRAEFSAAYSGSVLQPHLGGTTPRISQTPMPSSRMSTHASTVKSSIKSLNSMRYACAVVLIQEKGAVSTFRSIYRRLREEWKLDGMQSPMVGGGSVLMDQVQRVMA